MAYGISTWSLHKIRQLLALQRAPSHPYMYVCLLVAWLFIFRLPRHPVLLQFVISQPPSPPPRLNVYDAQELLSFYSRKTAAQHERNRNFVNIHDGIPADKQGCGCSYPGIFGILGVPYLSETLPVLCNARRAWFGVVSLATRLDGKAYWVHYLWDIDSPKMYISKQVFGGKIRRRQCLETFRKIIWFKSTKRD